jgi:hypothetical protein
MNSKVFAAGLAASVIPALASCNPTPGPQPLGAPAPILYLTGAEAYSTGGKDWIRHNYDVLNKDQYDPALFAAAPSLPPCGLNTNSSRTWVSFYDGAGNPIYGFCALGSPADLGSIWFATEEGMVPPSWVYIEMTDRQTNTVYKSNLAETTL